MLINLYFGDYYDDGHGHYEHVCIDAPNEVSIVRALEFLKTDYPNFFDQFACDYMDNSKTEREGVAHFSEESAEAQNYYIPNGYTLMNLLTK